MLFQPFYSRVFAAFLMERESERERLGRLLHDGVCQELSAAWLQLEALKLDYSTACPGLAERTGETQQILERGMRTLRDLSRELDAGTPRWAGLEVSLRVLLDGAARRFPGRTSLQFERGPGVPGTVEWALYRVAEEAVENVLRHAQAHRLDIHVTRQAAALVMEIRDDGRGFEPAKVDGTQFGVGLPMMAQYAKRCGGELKVDSSPASGTVVQVKLSIEDFPGWQEQPQGGQCE